ncbi:MAG: hypothetical protein MJE77_38470, partial [Proteobacteria bacterium]|nr:hypothetical protein [Pseudomonadota bacterium]
PSMLTEASKEFLKMLVSIAIAALAILGIRGNVGKGLKIADAIKIQPPKVGWSPAMVNPEGVVVPGGPVFTPGSIATTGPVDIGISAMTGVGSAGSKIKPGESKANTKTGEECPNATKEASGSGPPGSLGAMRRLQYEVNPKHGSVARGNASAAPKNGQAALDYSIPIGGNSTRRVGIDYATGEFVVFPEHLPGRFHGYVVPWDKLTQRMQSALRKAGMADKKGRILTD